jgi:imidazolonepropionase-like amidohydrolase
VRGVQNMPQRDDSPYDDAYTLPMRLHAAGIPFALTHNDDTAHERNLPYVLGTAVAHGLPMDVAIESVTLNAARVLGIDNTYGSLEVGKSATLFISTGNALEVTTDLTHAFIDGREIDLRSKQTELAKKYLERYEQTGDVKQGK